MAEQELKRYALKPKQWDALVNSTARINAVKQQLALEQERARVESELILESLGLDTDANVRVDPETKSLVEVAAPATPAEAPAAPIAPKARRTKKVR